MSNYINFYFDENDKFNAKIYKNGKYKIIRNEKNLLKLLEISKKHGYNINRAGTLRKGAKNITKDFDKYISRKHRLQVFNKIVDNMKLSRKNPAIGKTVIAATLLAVIAHGGMNLKKNENNLPNNDISYSTSETVNLEKTDIPNIESTVSEDLQLNNNENKEQEKNVETTVAQSQEVKEERKSQEIDSMLSSPSFHFSFEDRTSKQSITYAKRYEDLFEKYAKRYGLDKNLLMAIAAQESSGEHYNNLSNNKPAAGIMQIEKAVHIGHTVSAYNFQTNQIEKVNVTKESLQNIETNIQIGTMILRGCIENNNYNIPLAIQTYNMGSGNMSKVLSFCSNKEKLNINSIKTNPTNNKWLNYRSIINAGDSKYVEHVFSFLNNKTKLEVLKRDNQKVTVALANDYSKTNKL